MIKGHVFSKQTFGNPIFALFVNTFLGGCNGVVNGYKNSMAVSYSGSNVSISSGVVCVQGRFLEEDSSTTINAGTNTAYCKLVLTINLDRENTASVFNQGYYEILTSASAYPSLTQNNIVGTNEGTYQYELARFKTGLSGITDFVDKRTYLDFQSLYAQISSQFSALEAEMAEEYQSLLSDLEDEFESIEDRSGLVLKSSLYEVTGNITLNKDSNNNYNGYVNISYPNGFNSTNIHVLSAKTRNADSALFADFWTQGGFSNENDVEMGECEVRFIFQETQYIYTEFLCKGNANSPAQIMISYKILFLKE